MNKIVTILTLLLILTLEGRAQSTDSGTIAVHKDPRIELLVNKQIEINDITTRNARRSAPGYRILVISSNNRNKVIAAKTEIYQKFPELKAYLMYQAPFFRLKVGNFKEREDAEEYLSPIQKIFDNSVYIVPDTIEVRPDTDN